MNAEQTAFLNKANILTVRAGAIPMLIQLKEKDKFIKTKDLL